MRIVWHDEELRKVMNRDEVKSLLLEHGKNLASANDSKAKMHLHSPMRSPLYVAELRQLRVPVCVVHSHTNAGAAIGRKHKLPQK